MDMGFIVICRLARHRMPRIWFLYIGSRLCSALLSDPPSPGRPCASLSLHLHQVVKGTFTPELSNMLGTHKKGPLGSGPAKKKRPMTYVFFFGAFFFFFGIVLFSSLWTQRQPFLPVFVSAVQPHLYESRRGLSSKISRDIELLVCLMSAKREFPVEADKWRTALVPWFFLSSCEPGFAQAVRHRAVDP
jgi:hypothetical protein